VDDILPLEAGENLASLLKVKADRIEAITTEHDKKLAVGRAEIDRLLEQTGDTSMYRRQELNNDLGYETWRETDGDPEYRKLLQEVDDGRRKLDAALAFYAEDIRLAEMTSADDTKRPHWAAVVRDSDWQALRTLAVEARQEKNTALAVELTKAVKNMPRDKRPFSTADLIKATLPEAALKKQAFFLQAQQELDRFDRAKAKIFAHPRYRPSPHEKLVRGLRQPGAFVREPPATKNPTDNPTDRIRRGLDGGKA